VVAPGNDCDQLLADAAGMLAEMAMAALDPLLIVFEVVGGICILPVFLMLLPLAFAHFWKNRISWTVAKAGNAARRS
jgi:hypothetical protein